MYDIISQQAVFFELHHSTNTFVILFQFWIPLLLLAIFDLKSLKLQELVVLDNSYQICHFFSPLSHNPLGGDGADYG
jgi:hypothetical protein